jgi:quercetin dioxygenase-like cupin family protein
MTYIADGKFFELSAGDFIYLPSGVPHGFRTTGSTQCRVA